MTGPGDLAAVRDQAVHGSYCPKMCTFACPVAAATGREDAVPWGLHTTVAGLAAGAEEPTGDTAAGLRGCTGCHACRDACLWDLDVPAEVRAARTAVHDAGAADPAVAAAVAHVAAGRSPHGDALPVPPEAPGRPADLHVVVGCREEAATLDALARLLAAAGADPSWAVPDGCCGATLGDLGAADAAAERTSLLGARLAGAERVACLDPHCLPAVRAVAPEGATVTSVVAELAGLVGAERIRLTGDAPAVTYHDPCLLARDEDLVGAPRVLLAAAGSTVVEPEGAGSRTVCSGAGMAFDLLAPDDARRLAARRGGQLAAAGAPAVTACARAAGLLRAAGGEVRDLLVHLADHLDERG